MVFKITPGTVDDGNNWITGLAQQMSDSCSSLAQAYDGNTFLAVGVR